MEGSNTKLLQVVSLQNHFQNLNDDQISDLNRFECTKCVHISNLDFLDPMMFYKLREFHRLQVCKFWMDRTKDMN
jgi:hypothetical protein